MDIVMDDLQKWWYYVLSRLDAQQLIPMAESGKPEVPLKKLLKEERFDPEMILTWSGQWYGPKLLRERIIETQRYEDLSTDNVLVLAGTNEANFVATMVSLNPGDEVIILMPSWMQFYTICKHIIGARIRTHFCKEENSWKPDIEELKEFVSRKTKVLWLVNPCNPTGARLDRSDMRGIVEIAEDYGIWILQDEVYRFLEWDDRLSPSIINNYEKGVATNSITKTIGATGLRIGWLACRNRQFMERCNAFKTYTSLCTNILGEKLATVALEPDRFIELVEEGKKIGRTNLAIVDQWIREHDEMVSWVPPEGSYCGFLKYHFEIGSWEFCDRALEYGVLLAPGSGFMSEGHVRIGIGIATDLLKRGLNRFETYLKSLTRAILRT